MGFCYHFMLTQPYRKPHFVSYHYIPFETSLFDKNDIIRIAAQTHADKQCRSTNQKGDKIERSPKCPDIAKGNQNSNVRKGCIWDIVCVC